MCIIRGPLHSYYLHRKEAVWIERNCHFQRYSRESDFFFIFSVCRARILTSMEFQNWIYDIFNCTCVIFLKCLSVRPSTLNVNKSKIKATNILPHLSVRDLLTRYHVHVGWLLLQIERLSVNRSIPEKG